MLVVEYKVRRADMDTIAVVIGLCIIAVAVSVAIFWDIEKKAAISKLKYRHRKRLLIQT